MIHVDEGAGGNRVETLEIYSKQGYRREGGGGGESRPKSSSGADQKKEQNANISSRSNKMR